MSDLTNPDVLAALEIAPVEFAYLVCRHRLIAAKGAVYAQIDEGQGWETLRLATPADLDHAIPVWIQKLQDVPCNPVRIKVHNGDWSVVTNRYGHEPYEAPTLLQALAKALQAVVKVGKPEGEETDDG